MTTQHGARRGQWRYNRNNLTLEYIDRDPNKKMSVAYYVDLERCGTANDMLDWILQVAGKGWILPEDIGHLVRALEELAGYGLQGEVIEPGSSFDWKTHLS